MNVREDLHLLIDGLDGSAAKQLLHVLVNEMDEETAREPLARIRDVHRGFLKQMGVLYMTDAIVPNDAIVPLR
jgi:uncharacterized protein YdgA (DUF945 family)